MQEAADRKFCLGLQTLIAARRMEAALADDATKASLGRLAESYRTRAHALMFKAEPVR